MYFQATNPVSSPNHWRTRDFSAIQEHGAVGSRQNHAGSGFSLLAVITATLYLCICFAPGLSILATSGFIGLLGPLPFFIWFSYGLIHRMRRGIGKVAYTMPYLVAGLCGLVIIPYLIFFAYLLVLFLIGLVAIACSDESKHRRMTNQRETSQPVQKVFGVAGDLSSARGVFTAENIAKGEAGEKKTALMMEDLLRIPGVRIFHGCIWPGTKDADIDHIVVCGTKVAVVDSKMWSGGLYVLTPEERVVQLGRENQFFDRNVHFGYAVRAVIKMIPFTRGRRTKIFGWIAIHSSNTRAVTVDNSRMPYRMVSLSPAENAIDEIGAWFAEDTDGYVDGRMMYTFSSLLKR